MSTRRPPLLATFRTGVLGVALVLGLAGGLAGCGEGGPVDDGSYSALQAGAPAILDDLGVTLISLEQPTDADPNDVVPALAARRLDAETYSVRPVDGLALEPEKIAGLLGMAGNLEDTGSPSGEGRFVVLSFDRLEAAVVFAESDPEVFADATLEQDREAYFSGNLVAYYAPEERGDATDRFRAALDALAGT